MIHLDGVTKKFSNGRGIFDLSFGVPEGEVFGCLGPNGAGKSTTIRHLMGYMRPDSGKVRIRDLDCWTHAQKVQASVGYLPGEIGFLDNMSGQEFLNLLGGMRKMGNSSIRRQLTERFELDERTPIRKMSKGTKQKVGIIAAFMHQPCVLILDEPTSGLDPLMQQRFLELVEEEKQRGATILMSSHMFSEVERVCDRIGIIKNGKLVSVQEVRSLREIQRKVFRVSVGSEADVERMKAADWPIVRQSKCDLEIEMQANYNEFIKALAKCDVRALDVQQLNLEQIFMHFYEDGEEKHL